MCNEVTLLKSRLGKIFDKPAPIQQIGPLSFYRLPLLDVNWFGLVYWSLTSLFLHFCVNSETGEKPGSVGFGLTLTKPKGTQGIFILYAPIDSLAQHHAFVMQFGSTARGL